MFLLRGYSRLFKKKKNSIALEIESNFHRFGVEANWMLNIQAVCLIIILQVMCMMSVSITTRFLFGTKCTLKNFPLR